jgi:hypothetical protein
MKEAPTGAAESGPPTLSHHVGGGGSTASDGRYLRCKLHTKKAVPKRAAIRLDNLWGAVLMGVRRFDGLLLILLNFGKND